MTVREYDELCRQATTNTFTNGNWVDKMNRDELLLMIGDYMVRNGFSTIDAIAYCEFVEGPSPQVAHG